MKKRKYTKEQLEFYFKKLMKELKRVPTIEDLRKKTKFPSLTVYKQRFGSWARVVDMWGNKTLNVKKCATCGKVIPFKKKSKQFCSNHCAKMYKLKGKKPKLCMICKEPFFAHLTPQFRKRKICDKKDCKERFALIQAFKKSPALTKQKRERIMKLKGKKCEFCDFKEALEFHVIKGRCSEKRIPAMVKRNDWQFILICPNHHVLLRNAKT